MRHKKRAYLGVILVAAFVARGIFAGWVIGWDRAPFGDETDYHALAASFASGQGLSIEGHAVASRPPLYPVILGALYWVTGPEPLHGRLLQILLGTCVVALVYPVSRRIFSSGSAWIATLLAAFNPFLIFISGYLLTENLYMVLLLAALWITYPLPGGAQWPFSRLVAVGIVMGLAAMARPTALPVTLWVALGFVLFTRGAWWVRTARAVLLVSALVLTLLPWAARNHAHFGKWIFSTSHGGITFYQGNNERVIDVENYRGGVAPHAALPRFEELQQYHGIEQDEVAWAMGKDFLRDNSRDIPRLLWWKFQRFWRFKSDAGFSGVKSGWWWDKDSLLGRIAVTTDLGFAYAVWVIPLFIIGLATARRRFAIAWVAYGLVLAHTAVSLVFHGSLRMRSPIEPVIAMFAAYVIWNIVCDVRWRFSRVSD